MGVGKFYLVSPKSCTLMVVSTCGLDKCNLKESMAAELTAAAEKRRHPDLIDRIADGNTVTTAEQLVAWVKEKNHPVLEMGPMVPKSARAEEPAAEVIAKAEAIVEAAIAKQPAKDAEVKPAVAEPPQSTPVLKLLKRSQRKSPNYQ